MPTYDPTTWVEGVTALGPVNLNKIEQGIAGALPKDGSDPLTGNLNHDQAAPLSGQVKSYWTLRQAGADVIRHGLDESGNLVVQRWTGAAWSNVLTVQVGSALVLASVDQVDGFHFRLTGAGATAILEYSSDGNNWAPAGLPPAQIRAIARRY